MDYQYTPYQGAKAVGGEPSVHDPVGSPSPYSPHTYAIQQDSDQASRETKEMYPLPPHVTTTFEGIFKETQSATSFRCMRVVNKKVYELTHFIFYALLDLFIGPLLSFAWGLIFGLSHIMIVWVSQPLVKLFFVWLRIIGMNYSACIRLVLDPLYTSMSLIFSGIRVRTQIADSRMKTTSAQDV